MSYNFIKYKIDKIFMKQFLEHIKEKLNQI